MAIEVVFKAKEFLDGYKQLPTKYASLYKNVFPGNCLQNQGKAANGKTLYTGDCWNTYKAYTWCKGILPTKKGDYVYSPGKFGLGDWNGATIYSKCSDKSTDFSKGKIVPAECMLTADDNHFGIYCGDWTGTWEGKTYTWNTIETTPIWSNGIQATYVDEKGRRFNHKGGSQAGSWAKHGKLPWIDYGAESPKETLTVSVDTSKYDKINITLT